MKKTFREIIERLEAAIEEKDARVTVAEDLPFLKFDPVWAAEAFYNLINNAIKYTVPGRSPEIEIARYEAPGEIGIAVRDRGPGVADALRERIFELFQRGETRTEGTGAGLAIVAEVSRRHGGRVFVRDRDGGGSEFIVALPA